MTAFPLRRSHRSPAFAARRKKNGAAPRFHDGTRFKGQIPRSRVDFPRWSALLEGLFQMALMHRPENSAANAESGFGKKSI